eukprot:322464_1
MCDIQMHVNESRSNMNESRHRSKRKLSHSLSSSLSSWIYSNSYLGQTHKKTKKKIMKNTHGIHSEKDHEKAGHRHSVSVIALNDNAKESIPNVTHVDESQSGRSPLKDIDINGLTLQWTGDVDHNNTGNHNSDSSGDWATTSYQEMPKTPSCLKQNEVDSVH